MSISNHKIFVKLNLPIFLVLMRQRGKLQKFGLLTRNLFTQIPGVSKKVPPFDWK